MYCVSLHVQYSVIPLIKLFGVSLSEPHMYIIIKYVNSVCLSVCSWHKSYKSSTIGIGGLHLFQ